MLTNLDTLNIKKVIPNYLTSVTFSKNNLLYKLILFLFNVIFICFYKIIYKYNYFIENNKFIIYNCWINLLKFIYKAINNILLIYDLFFFI